jgi:hypothetical protein
MMARRARSSQGHKRGDEGEDEEEGGEGGEEEVVGGGGVDRVGEGDEDGFKGERVGVWGA